MSERELECMLMDVQSLDEVQKKCPMEELSNLSSGSDSVSNCKYKKKDQLLISDNGLISAFIPTVLGSAVAATATATVEASPRKQQTSYHNNVSSEVAH